MEVETERARIREQARLCQMSQHIADVEHDGNHCSTPVGPTRLRSGILCGMGGSDQLGSPCPSPNVPDTLHCTLDLDWLQQIDAKYQGQPASDPIDFYTAGDVHEWSDKLGSDVSEVIARFEDPENGHDPLLLCTISGECYLLLDFLFYPLGHDTANVQASLTDIASNGLETRKFLDPYRWLDMCETNNGLLAALAPQVCT